MNSRFDLSIKVSGLAGSVIREVGNVDLVKAYIKAAITYRVNNGIAKSGFSFLSFWKYGCEMVADNKTAAGRTQNRRVMAITKMNDVDEICRLAVQGSL